MSKLIKMQITLNLRNSERRIDAECSGCWAVHKSINRVLGYTVTFLPTGELLLECKKKADALLALERIQNMQDADGSAIDWQSCEIVGGKHKPSAYIVKMLLNVRREFHDAVSICAYHHAKESETDNA